MVVLRVSIDTNRARNKLERLIRGLSRRRNYNRIVALKLRDYVRNTIRMQGRTRPYVPLSNLRKKATGRRKALITLVPNIKARWTATTGEVYFQRKSPAWHIDQHHRGFTVSASPKSKLFRIPGTKFAWRGRKSYKVPAREVWPTKAMAQKIAFEELHKWVQRVASRI